MGLFPTSGSGTRSKRMAIIALFTTSWWVEHTTVITLQNMKSNFKIGQHQSLCSVWSQEWLLPILNSLQLPWMPNVDDLDWIFTAIKLLQCIFNLNPHLLDSITSTMPMKLTDKLLLGADDMVIATIKFLHTIFLHFDVCKKWNLKLHLLKCLLFTLFVNQSTGMAGPWKRWSKIWSKKYLVFTTRRDAHISFEITSAHLCAAVGRYQHPQLFTTRFSFCLMF